MRYTDFENIMTPARMGRYLTACRGNTRKAMTMYRKNLQLSKELFTVISCFHIALRNAIDQHYSGAFGDDWLRIAAAPGGIVDNIRNRIAHHEPICFLPGNPVKNTTYARQHYNLILQFFHWMSIDEAALLYGLDHINTVCNEIDAIRESAGLVEQSSLART